MHLDSLMLKKSTLNSHLISQKNKAYDKNQINHYNQPNMRFTFLLICA